MMIFGGCAPSSESGRVADLPPPELSAAEPATVAPEPAPTVVPEAASEEPTEPPPRDTFRPLDLSRFPPCAGLTSEPARYPVTLRVSSGSQTVGRLTIEAGGRLAPVQLAVDLRSEAGARLMAWARHVEHEGRVHYRQASRPDRHGRGGSVCHGEVARDDPAFPMALRLGLRSHGFRATREPDG